ncbi:MAG: hypothetical protein HQL25_03630 [Candidatus Omnitrophica bacterium]|nr:hypothetical protein [Candidatus Omnitrophota bacterium]
MQNFTPHALDKILEQLPKQGWLVLGEALSNLSCLGLFPIYPDQREKFVKEYEAKNIAALVSFDGNTLTEAQVKDRLAQKLFLPVSQEYLGRQVDILNNILNKLSGAKGESRPSFNAELAADCFKEIESQFDLSSGNFSPEVFVSEEKRIVLEQVLASVIKRSDFNENIIEALLLHYNIQKIKPFKLHNNLLAKIFSQYLLVQAGLPLWKISALNQHFNITKTEYLRRIDAEIETAGVDFIIYALRGLSDGWKTQIIQLSAMQNDICWSVLLEKEFAGNSEGERRQKILMQELSRKSDVVERNDLAYMSQQVNEMYKHRHPRTLMRDIKDLEDKRLIIREGKFYRVNKESIKV